MADYGGPRRSPARYLAPLALLLFGVAFALVVLSFASEQSDGDGDGEQTTTQRGQQTTPRDARPRRSMRAAYRVKLNDTLGLIAEKTGVGVERIQELNPELDPQNLIVGQRIKLRE